MQDCSLCVLVLKSWGFFTLGSWVKPLPFHSWQLIYTDQTMIYQFFINISDFVEIASLYILITLYVG